MKENVKFKRHERGGNTMYRAPYDEDFKKSIVTLFQNGKSQSQLSKGYGVSLSAINKWVRLYSTVQTDDVEIAGGKAG